MDLFCFVLMTIKKRKTSNLKNEKNRKRKASQSSLLVRTGGAIIRQKTDASQTNTDSFDIYNKSLVLTKALPYMDITSMSSVQCTSHDVHERIHDLLETMYPHFEGYKRSVAAYHNFLSRTC